MLIVGHDAVAFTGKPGSCSHGTEAVGIDDIITVMGPGKWLGTHIWDIRVISFTKAYFQVCHSQRG